MPVALAADTEPYGDVPPGLALHSLPDGLGVKVVGTAPDGVLAARRIKFYPPDDDTDRELRGTVAAVDAARRRVRIDGLWTDWTDATEFELDRPRPRLERTDVARIVDLGAAGAVRAGYAVETRLFDLREDPGEQRAVDAPEIEAELADRLETMARRLLLRAVHVAPAALPDDALEELRKIGYAR